MRFICVGLFSATVLVGANDTSESFGLLQSVPRTNLMVQEEEAVMTDVAEKSRQISSDNVLQCNVVPQFETAQRTDGWCQSNCRAAADGAFNGHPACAQVTSQSQGESKAWPTTCFCMMRGCTGFDNVGQDCTNTDLKAWDGTSFQNSGQGHQWAKTSSCVAYVSTGGGTCKDFCETNGKTCVRAMDDAHQQTAQIPTLCTLLPSGHHRQSQKDNGCNQQWSTQICACA